jgi:Fe-S-cluster containining protein
MTSDPRTPEDIFNCRQCGDCCKGYGGTFVTDTDIEKIAHYIAVPKEDVATQYCQLSGKRRVLTQNSDGYCIFWNNGLCGIHPIKPRMCREWPFIQAVVSVPANWKMMATACKGIRTDVPDSIIRDIVAEAIKKRNQEES